MVSDLVSSPVRTEKARDIRLARVEASDTRPAGGVCAGDKRGYLLDRYVPWCVGCVESGEADHKQRVNTPDVWGQENHSGDGRSSRFEDDLEVTETHVVQRA